MGLAPKANQGQGSGAKRKEPKPSRFEQVASAAEEFQQIGEQLGRSRAKADKQLSSKVCTAYLWHSMSTGCSLQDKQLSSKVCMMYLWDSMLMR